MEFAALQTLVTTVECGTLTEAARRLHLSQPAATHQIHQLERELGLALFERTGRRLVLTDVGRRVVARARRILQEVDDLAAEVRDLREAASGEVRVGGGAAAMIHLLPALVQRYRQAHPGVRLFLREGHSQSLIDDVRAGRLDAAVVTLPCAASELSVVPWRHESVVLVGWPGAPLARGPISPEALQEAPFITFGTDSPMRELVSAALATLGVAVQAVMEVQSIEAAKAHVAAGMGYAAVGATSVGREVEEGRLVVLDVQGLSLSRELGWTYRTHAPRSPAVQAFLALAFG